MKTRRWPTLTALAALLAAFSPALLPGLPPGARAGEPATVTNAPPKPATTFKTYNMKTAPDEVPAIVTALKEMLGQDRQIFHYKAENQLLVSVTEAEHQLIEALLAGINQPAPNVRLDVTFREVATHRDTRAGVQASGDVEVTRHGTRSTVRLSPELRHQSGGMDALNQQTLVMMSGREASIQLGQDVPYYEWLVEYGLQWGIIQQKRIVEKIGSFLTASAQVIGKGPMVSVTLTPELRELAGKDRQRIAFKRVATTLTVRDGATISIGGSADHKDFYEKFLVGAGASGTTRTLDISLTVRILKPDGTPLNP